MRLILARGIRSRSAHVPLCASTFLFAVGCHLGFVSASFGQKLAVGIVAGSGITDDFHNRISAPVLGVSPGFGVETAAKRYLVGASVEFRPKQTWSIEIDAIYRPLGFRQFTLIIDGSRRSISPATVVTWEFPVLAKVRLFKRGFSTPFVTAGPSFRTAGNLNGTRPGPVGITAGLGADFNLRGVRLSPSLRYTRWAPVRGYSVAPNRLDQVEAVVGVSRPGTTTLASRMSFAVLFGRTLTNDYDPSSGTSGLAGARAWIGGPQIEIRWTDWLSIETGAVYHPFRVRSATPPHRSESVRAAWDVPVLARARFSSRPVTPFLAVGPSLRRPQELQGARLSAIGLTGEAGVEWKFGKVRIFPAIRYTRWKQDSAAGRSGVSRNQVMLFVGFGAY